ncbi:RDD family protein [Actinomadura craniellae]|uniref:RDD family protein n=1 Tax=Actinomadura craniellae TaxID=2231787 RepID=A0A365H8Q0_9ACTN|nr:RDD family protein [Actinomadura craniellae]RAY15336.1 RDD family protein [Actinomadura craniellae]
MPPTEAAEPGPRLVARLIDTLVVGLPVVAVVQGAGLSAELVLPLALPGLLLVYEAVQLALWGRTLGKRLTGLAVVPQPDAGRSRLDPARAALRAATYALPLAAQPVPVLDVLAGLFWVGNAAFALEEPRRQALHDRLAGTRVIAVTASSG